MDERQRPLETLAGGTATLAAAEGLDDLRANLDGILAEADKILDNLRPINAEEYLQQNRQRGGE